MARGKAVPQRVRQRNQMHMTSTQVPKLEPSYSDDAVIYGDLKHNWWWVDCSHELHDGNLNAIPVSRLK